jgi:hypothetical protein
VELVLPQYEVPRAPQTWSSRTTVPASWLWDGAALPDFYRADGSGPARQQTVTRVCFDAQALYVRFDCDDRDIWGTYTDRDDPIYDQEVVELFIGPGSATPSRYFEFEVSPNSTLLDAAIFNPTSRRADLKLDLSWNCPGLTWEAGRDERAGRWWAILIIPWMGLVPDGDLPATWRANFYRIERPRDEEPEFSCWSPTMTEPADFHKPAFFGTLHLETQ